MGYILGFIAATVFLFGLFQWAQGGATLWNIFRIKRNEKQLSRAEKQEAEAEIKKLERAADRTISTSFRIIAILAVLVWVFLGVTMVLDMFGVNWVSSLSTKAKTYWAGPSATTNQIATQQRNDMLRNMGNSLRR